MNNTKHIDELAPCGLNCRRCARAAEGPIRKSAESLISSLQGFASFAEKYAGINSLYADYPVFEKFLIHLTKADCSGCRSGSECFGGCAAKTCHRDNGVDYCFQCLEYPCSKNSFPPALDAKWRSNNDFMKEKGIEAFYEKQKKEPRY